MLVLDPEGGCDVQRIVSRHDRVVGEHRSLAPTGYRICPSPQGGTTAEAFEELRVAWEELRASQEEVSEQQEALAASRQTLEVERQRYPELFDLALKPTW
jgi:hypothetical protein